MIDKLDALKNAGVDIGSSPEEIDVEKNNQNQEATPPVDDESSLKENNQTQEKQSEEETKEKSEGESDSFGEFVDERAGTAESSKSEKTPDFLTQFNEKFGTSYEDEGSIEQGLKPPSVSEQALAIDKYLKETGHTLGDYFRTQVIDYTKFPDKEIVIQSMMNDGKSREDAVTLFEDEFSHVSIDEDTMDESEIANAKRRNKAVDTRIKYRADDFRNKMKAEKEKYSTSFEGYKAPSETQDAGMTDEEKNAWSSSMSESLKEIETMSLNVADGKSFKFSNADFLKENPQLKNAEEALGMFLNEDDDSWNTTRFARAIALEANIDKIVSSVYRNAYGAGVEDTAKGGRNIDYNENGGKSKQDVSKDENIAKAREIYAKHKSGGKMQIIM